MMYCENCRSFFEDDKVIKIIKPASATDDIKDAQIEELCPYCYNGFIDKAKRCGSCMAYITPEQTICEDCADVAEGIFRSIRSEIVRRAKNEPSMDIMNEGIRDYLIARINYLFS